MNARCTFALVLACLLPLAAAAQYQWIDKDGRKVFSDRPPPSDIPADKILRQPRGVAMPVDQPAAPASAARAAVPVIAGSAPRIAGRDKALEDKKKQAEAAETAKKKVEEEKVALQKEDNCRRAKQSKASYESGERISRTNEKGERTVLEDGERAREVVKLEEIIARDCAK